MSRRRVSVLMVLGLLAAAAVAVSGGEKPGPALAASSSFTRYSLVHGCFRVRSGASVLARADSPFRMQAAALGQYLLYGRHQDFLGSGQKPVATPSRSTVWVVNGSSRRGFTIKNLARGRSMRVSFTPTGGCAVYPEAQVDANGPGFTGGSPEGSVSGTVEGHAHITAFELFGGDWHCGSPWSPYGAPFALPASCAADEQGSNGEVEAFLDFGGPNRPSDFHGWPTFVGWPTPTSLAEEGDYYTGVKRAWRAGLRVFVTQLVDNEALCRLMTTRHLPCNDMSSVRVQSRDLYALQNYIDAQSGGPGRGWFRIVNDPFQARRVINQGKLVVVEGVEMSRIFGCGEVNDVNQCGTAQVDAGLKEFHSLGIRTFFPIHEFNNAFGGTKMISGETGAIVNAGNREETGSFWTVQPCPASQQDAPQTTFPATGSLATLLNGPVAGYMHGSAAPVYPPGPHCNVRGITPLGTYLIKQMIKQHYLIQLDHMSSKTATAALAVAESKHYAGVVSAHCCSSAQLFKRIYATGGFITPPQDSPVAFDHIYKQDRAERSPKYRFGFGWGSDMNGLADQTGAIGNTAAAIRYPFKSFMGNVTFTREQWGQRKFDINTDGLANYGLYADWLSALQRVGGPQLMSDMFQGAEAFLETWERADGVPVGSCRPSHGVLASSQLPLGVGFPSLLYRDGQPVLRLTRAYRYCVNGSLGATLAAVFTPAGNVGMWVTDAPGWSAGAVRPGAAASALPGHKTALGGRVFVGPVLGDGSRYVYGVRGGRVDFVGRAVGSLAGNAQSLRAAIAASGVS